MFSYKKWCILTIDILGITDKKKEGKKIASTLATGKNTGASGI